MHASNLLKVVLKPRTIKSSSSGQSLSTKDAKSRGTRASSPDGTALASLSVNKKSNPAPVPVKTSCLCAPTNHAGSFRCRLHRGMAQSRGRTLLPLNTPSAKDSPQVSQIRPAVAPVPVGNGSAKLIVHRFPTSRQPFGPVHRTCEVGRSRLSKVSTVVTDVEVPVYQSQAVISPARDEGKTVPYLKFTGDAGCASGAVLEGGVVYINKLQLQTGGKHVMQEVFGSSTGLSRARFVS